MDGLSPVPSPAPTGTAQPSRGRLGEAGPDRRPISAPWEPAPCPPSQAYLCACTCREGQREGRSRRTVTRVSSPRFCSTTTTGPTETRRTETTPTAACLGTSTRSTSRHTTTWSVPSPPPPSLVEPEALGVPSCPPLCLADSVLREFGDVPPSALLCTDAWPSDSITASCSRAGPAVWPQARACPSLSLDPPCSEAVLGRACVRLCE